MHLQLIQVNLSVILFVFLKDHIVFLKMFALIFLCIYCYNFN